MLVEDKIKMATNVCQCRGRSIYNHHKHSNSKIQDAKKVFLFQYPIVKKLYIPPLVTMRGVSSLYRIIKTKTLDFKYTF